MEQLYSINTVEDVAKYLRVSVTTVYRLVKSGKLKSIKYLGRLRITKEAVEEFINL
ncbi:helix-turn-helix domain-containing protein [Lachnoclostridium sp.]|uniref:helix-turn-helix domain-containing protein n=1 Tax=Lachnoclostridium sp. TaxID=2028282 RepID=UPI00289AA2EE|nr:helix-turn-helix domain-containing protein [Lachnoclostridium sp.]